MHRFDIGEYVHIKKNAKDIFVSPCLGFNSEGEMDKYIDTDQLIAKRYYHQGYPVYQLKDVSRDRAWVWSEEWLEPTSITNIEDIEDDAFDSILSEGG